MVHHEDEGLVVVRVEVGVLHRRLLLLPDPLSFLETGRGPVKKDVLGSRFIAIILLSICYRSSCFLLNITEMPLGLVAKILRALFGVLVR